MSTFRPEDATATSTIQHPTPPSPSPPAAVRLAFGARTHVGKVRKTNEDQFLIARLTKELRVLRTSLPCGESPDLPEPEVHLLAVADGMGGAAAGERASSLVIAEMERYLLETAKWFFRSDDEEGLRRDVNKGLRWLDRILIDEGQANWSRTGMGTTLSAAFCFGDELTVIHVGDSRVYLYRDGSLRKLTRDHTLTQLLVDGGLLSPDQATLDRRRHILTNVLGGPSAGVSGDVDRLRLQDGDRLLLCTDGLTDPLPESEIASVLRRFSDPEDAARALIDEALDAGAPDNVTVVVASFAFRPGGVITSS